MGIIFFTLVVCGAVFGVAFVVFAAADLARLLYRLLVYACMVIASGWRAGRRGETTPAPPPWPWP